MALLILLINTLKLLYMQYGFGCHRNLYVVIIKEVLLHNNDKLRLSSLNRNFT